MAEFWDAYNAHRCKRGYTLRRGILLSKGEYHLVAEMVLVSASGQLFMTQRGALKSHAGQWEFPGGAVCAGEDSLTGIYREIREETGLDLHPTPPFLLSSTTSQNRHLDTYGLQKDVDISRLQLQESEVSGAHWIDPAQLEVFHCPPWVVTSSFDTYHRIKGQITALPSQANIAPPPPSHEMEK